MTEPRCGVTNPVAIVMADRPDDRRQVGLTSPEQTGGISYVKRQF
jgi:hypothetical protein